MLNRNVRALTACSSCLVAFLAVGSVASAQCDPMAFMVRDPQSIQWNETIEIAFVLAATKDQFNEAKKMGATVQYGLIGGSATYEEARAIAMKVAQVVKFNNTRSYYVNFLSQQLSGRVQEEYAQCLKGQQGEGVFMWLDKREGEFVFINAFWVGDQAKAIGEYDREPRVVPENTLIVEKPSKWLKGKTEQLILKKSPDVEAFVSFSVSGQQGRFVVVRDPIPITMATQEVIGSKLMASSFHVSGSVCGGGSAEDCVTPKKPGGYLVRGSGRLKDFSARIISSAGFTVTVDTPDRVCVRLTVSTGACEARNSGEGVVTAIERYPEVPQ